MVWLDEGGKIAISAFQVKSCGQIRRVPPIFCLQKLTEYPKIHIAKVKICSPLDLPKGPGGVIFCAMCNEPAVKRTVVFFDGQNLFHQAQEAFDYKYPNYSPLALASQVCKAQRFNLEAIHFYTGNATDKAAAIMATPRLLTSSNAHVAKWRKIVASSR